MWSRAVLSLLLALHLSMPAAHAREPAPRELREIAVAELPLEARDTLGLIRRGGPFPHAKDGTVFFNRERQLPAQRLRW